MRDLLEILRPEIDREKEQAVHPDMDSAVTILLRSIPTLGEDKARDLAAQVVTAALGADKARARGPL